MTRPRKEQAVPLNPTPLPDDLEGSYIGKPVGTWPPCPTCGKKHHPHCEDEALVRHDQEITSLYDRDPNHPVFTGVLLGPVIRSTRPAPPNERDGRQHSG